MTDAEVEDPAHRREELIRRVQSGEDGAREELFRQSVKSVYATAHRLTGNAADAEDITQDTFVRVFQSIDGFRGRSTFRTWLYRILLNVTYDHFRKRAKESAYANVEQIGNTSGPLAGAARDPADEASSREQRRLLRAALGELPEKERVALTLVYLASMSCREAAAVMEAREGTVYWWLHEGRKRLARRLAPRMGPAQQHRGSHPRKE